MKKIFIFSLCILLTSCASSYYFVNLEEDTPIYERANDTHSALVVIPKGYSAYVATGTKKYRKVKWKNYKGWAVNPVYNIVSKSSTYNSSSNTSNRGRKYSSSGNSSGKTVSVKGYTRKDGTYVRPHTRSAPRRK